MADPSLAVGPITVHVDDPDDAVKVDPKTGTMETRQDDGGVVVQFNAVRPGAKQGDEDKWFRNLVNEIDAGKLSIIANALFDAVSADDRSRAGYLGIVERAIDLLGLELKEPKSGTSDSSGAVEGMSSVTNPLLLDAILRGWANTVGELLPANGPVKIRDDGEAETAANDDLAESLERDMNHYFTKGAPEYYPDTSHMLLWGPYFKGSGFKKVYRCPIERRPVSESVDAKDLIVSDTTKDLKKCERITHYIPMRPSVLKVMVAKDVYRKVGMTQPSAEPNRVDQAIAGIQGTAVTPERPEDQPYNIWETQCKLTLKDYIPTNSYFHKNDIAAPFLVTMDKDTREILAVRRDWNEDDEDCRRRVMYVRYPYVPGPGFYGTGMLNILGNSTAALTAAVREALDAGMFASFPGGLIDEAVVAQQRTSLFRVSPGQFDGVKLGGRRMADVVSPMPYRDVTQGLLGTMDRILAQAKPLSGAADIPAAEGIQNVPVGTMLAQIEQATKVMAAAHKGMHQAQSEEFDLIFDLFRENPEDFWRGNDVCPKGYWSEEKFVTALDTCNLVPVSDPNVPSHIHRIAKAIALIQLQQAFPENINKAETARRALAALKEDPQGLFIDAPPAAAPAMPPASPDKMITAQARMLDAQTKAAGAQTEAAGKLGELQTKQDELQTEKEIAGLNLQREMVIHAGDAQREVRQQAHDQAMERAAHGLDVVKHVHDVADSNRQHGLEVRRTAHDQAMDAAGHALDVQQAMKPEAKAKE